jgi:acyl-CoA oxidase
MAQPRETTSKDKLGRVLPCPAPTETMALERANAPFDKRSLTYALHGGKENTLLKERFMTEFARDTNFRLDDVHEQPLDELRRRAMAKMHSLVHYVTTEPLPIFQKRMELIGTLDPGFWTRCVVASMRVRFLEADIAIAVTHRFGV